MAVKRGEAVFTSADALDDNFQLDYELLATGDEAAGEEEERQTQEEGSTRRRRLVRPVSTKEEDDFLLDDVDDEEVSQLNNGAPREGEQSSQDEDEYGLPVIKKRVLDRIAHDSSSHLLKQNTPEDKKRKRREKLKAAKVRRNVNL